MSEQERSELDRLLNSPTDVAASIDASLFDKQRAFDTDGARRKAAFCTRRAGKTDYIPKKLVKRALQQPGSERVFLGITRTRARELLWRPLTALNERYRLGIDMREQLAELRFRNGSVVRLRGADDIKEAGKGRGDKLWSVDIDEAQIYAPGVLRELVDDVYGPTLEDVGGELCLYGTPGIICAGKWYGITHPVPGHREAGWSVHQWSVLDNPFMSHMRERLPQLKAERGWSDDNPTWLREWCGRWVNDTSALFYRFDEVRNTHDLPESHFLGRQWTHVVGWDLGLRDEMALVAWAFCEEDPNVYEAHSWKKSGVTSDFVMGEVKKLEARGYRFQRKVADTGGLGALVVEEVGQRTGVHFEAAKKTDKGAHVELFNDDLQTGRVKLRRGSAYAQEIAVLPKDPRSVPDETAKAREEVGGQPATKWPEEDPRFPNHCCDAGLYAWRSALHWLHRPKDPPPPKPGSPDFPAWSLAKQKAELDAALEEGMRRKRREREELQGDVESGGTDW